jgi:hypothetical protein
MGVVAFPSPTSPLTLSTMVDTTALVDDRLLLRLLAFVHRLMRSPNVSLSLSIMRKNPFGPKQGNK